MMVGKKIKIMLRHFFLLLKLCQELKSGLGFFFFLYISQNIWKHIVSLATFVCHISTLIAFIEIHVKCSWYSINKQRSLSQAL